MINISEIAVKSVLAFVPALSSQISVAGVATIFDDLNFVAYREGRDFSGFYNSRAGVFSCGFLFYGRIGGVSSDENKMQKIRVMTFDFFPHAMMFTYDRRDPRSDIYGTIFMEDSKVSLKTDSPHGGCQSMAGMFDSVPEERGLSTFTEVHHIDAIGIFAITKKAFLYSGAGSGRTGKYLLPGDLVIGVRRLDGYVFVRFVNPDSQIDENDSKRVVTGWVRLADLVDPFPPTLKH